MTEIKEGFEPYIPSVHLKNIAPYDWLKKDDTQDFLRKLEEYELHANEVLADAEVRASFMQQALDAKKCIKCGRALLQDGAGWLSGKAKIFFTQDEISENGVMLTTRWNEKSIKTEDIEVEAHLCFECIKSLKLYKETPQKELNF